MICVRCGHEREEHEENLHAPCNHRDANQHCICYAFVAPHSIGCCCAQGLCGEDRFNQAKALLEKYGEVDNG